MNIAGKRILITGAAVRIGAAFVAKFAEYGAEIIIHYNKSEIEAKKLLKSLKGENHILYQCDLSDINNLNVMFQDIGHIDILINNASVYNDKHHNDENLEEATYQMNINYYAPVKLMNLFAQQTNLQNGIIINMLDQRINKSCETGSYIQSKKKLAEKTQKYALKYAPKIRVNAIAPGPVLPPVWCKNGGMTTILVNVPLQKKVELNDIVDGCYFLIKNDSITGEILYIDCGQHLVTMNNKK